MIDRRQTVLNVTLSVVQVVITGATFFVLYRYLLDALGEEEFGVWSIVLATTTASGVANLGLAAGATKYVAQYLARDETDRVRDVIETAAISVACTVGLVLLVAYPLLRLLLDFVIEHDVLAGKAFEILPYSLVSFWLTSIAIVALSCVAGFQRVDLRAIVQSAVSIVYLVLAVVLVERSGLIGLAQAQVLQSALLCGLGWWITRRIFQSVSILPIHWRWETFKEMLGYGVNLQIISVARMLFEPTTTSLLSKYGGVGMVAYYEMARRMVIQLRALFATAHEALVPTIADVHERTARGVQDLYAQSSRVLSFLIAPSLPLFVGLAPLISILWIGSYNALFVAFSCLLFFGWFLNMGAAPAYYANLGTGELRWNVISHVVNGILNLILGIVLGLLFGGIGVVVGFVVSLIAASVLVAVPYELKHKVGIRQLVDKQTILLAIVGLGAMGAMLGSYFAWGGSHLATVFAISLVGYGMVILPLMAVHPLYPILSSAFGSLFHSANEGTRGQ